MCAANERGLSALEQILGFVVCQRKTCFLCSEVSEDMHKPECILSLSVPVGKKSAQLEVIFVYLPF